MIIIINLKFRKAKGQDAAKLEFKTPLHPYSNYVCLAFLVMIVGLMTKMDDMKMAVYILPAWLLILWVGFKIKKSTESKEVITTKAAK
jgi:amino acid transporter, AAT family